MCCYKAELYTYIERACEAVILGISMHIDRERGREREALPIRFRFPSVDTENPHQRRGREINPQKIPANEKAIPVGYFPLVAQEPRVFLVRR